jgi:hypothetical protein
LMKTLQPPNIQPAQRQESYRFAFLGAGCLMER